MSNELPIDPSTDPAGEVLDLQRLALFRRLTNDQCAEIEAIATRRSVAAGHWVFEAGSPRLALHVVLEGQVELALNDPFHGSRRLVVFERDDFFGEGALLGDGSHGHSAIAVVDTELLEIPKDAFAELSERGSVAAIRLLRRIGRALARRMKEATGAALGAQGDSSKQFASTGRNRTEHDLLGDKEVPSEAYYGVQTLRGVDNFQITGIPISHYPELIKSLAMVKVASARANAELGQLPDEVARAIDEAGSEIVRGDLHPQFLLDVIQGGAGTSTNMNANEVIANRANEILGGARGDYSPVHPNDHVNLGQSTNDVYPTAIKLAILHANRRLVRSLESLVEAFHAKAAEFSDILKMGRTQLQDAVPITLGQEFEAYGVTLSEEIERLAENSRLFLEVNLGGTAIGTGLNADPALGRKAVKRLRELSGFEVVLAANLVESTQDTGSFVMYSSALKRLAVKLSKICNDLRLLSSGPRAGLAEIRLPAQQPGSSIMPGKVNPVIPEVVNQIAFKVIGNDLTVTLAAEAGQLELNVMEPVIAQSIFESIEMLKNGIRTLEARCVRGIEADRDVCHGYVKKSIGLVTALVPRLGYKTCSQLAKEAQATGKGIYELVLEKELISAEELVSLLDPSRMVGG